MVTAGGRGNSGRGGGDKATAGMMTAMVVMVAGS